MLWPAETYTTLGSGLILIVASYYTVKKIRKGSRSGFAYTLVAFTILNAVQDFAFFYQCIDTSYILHRSNNDCTKSMCKFNCILFLLTDIPLAVAVWNAVLGKHCDLFSDLNMDHST